MHTLKFIPVDPKNPGSSWNEVSKACDGALTPWGIKTLRSGLDGCVKTVLVEPFYLCKDFRNLYSSYYSKKFLATAPVCKRLHFFSEEVPSWGYLMHNHDGLRDRYVGYSVIQPLPERCLGRTVISPAKIGKTVEKRFFCLNTAFRAHVAGMDFSVSGYPYISQTGDVTLCAQAALWGVCRYLSERYPRHPEMYPHELIDVIDPGPGRKTPYQGMTYEDYVRILSESKCFPVVMKVKNKPDSPNQDIEVVKDLYSYVESGFPVLASLHDPDEERPVGHAVALIGHTLDFNQPPKEGAKGFIDSCSFLKEFIVVDDGRFPYALLGPKPDPGTATEQMKARYYKEHIYTAVCPLPEKVFLPARYAREHAIKTLINLRDNPEPSVDVSCLAPTNEPLVTRLFLTANNSFKRRKLEMAIATTDEQKFDAIATILAQIDLPHFIWVLEAAPLSLYRQGKCCCEIVNDATAGKDDTEAILWVRVGNASAIGKPYDTFDKMPKTFPQYTHNLGERSTC